VLVDGFGRGVDSTRTSTTSSTPSTPQPRNVVPVAVRRAVTDEFAVQRSRTIDGPPPPAPSDANSPAPVQTGTLDYYRERYDDFVRRNPGLTPPPYYLNYGDKYVQRFSALGPKDLSPAGLAWRDRCLLNLQNAIEAKRAADPAGFAQLERDPQKFEAFCFDTHAKAYLDAGLLQLPAQDLVRIVTTPDLRDLVSPEGLKQIGQILGSIQPQDLENVAVATGKDELSQLPSQLQWLQQQLPHFPLPLPGLPKFPNLPWA
jgi:hypothetical protein